MEKNYLGLLAFNYYIIFLDLLDHMILTLINDDSLATTSKPILLEINNKKSSFMLEKITDIL